MALPRSVLLCAVLGVAHALSPSIATGRRLFQQQRPLHPSRLFAVQSESVRGRWDQFNDWAAEGATRLKGKAQNLVEQGSEATWLWSRLRFYSQAAAVYSVFVLYRAYRGFVIVLPQVFIEVNDKLKEGVASRDDGVKDDVDKQGNLKWRSRVVITIGAILYTTAILMKLAGEAFGRIVTGIVRGLAGVLGLRKSKNGNR
uniref:Uncharacterized protein n=1 Tax=Pinguiococcus pyrenoidosus TaxID=172671 RepID=A0A7R9U3R9_9STRA|mmetsp:Transcript_13882/g.51831  ORF Transcript_13882/g.51831 Transcript_13882/m.51831 type:complete len:200 (+) Transcript_13882:59-658(+)